MGAVSSVRTFRNAKASIARPMSDAQHPFHPLSGSGRPYQVMCERAECLSPPPPPPPGRLLREDSARGTTETAATNPRAPPRACARPIQSERPARAWELSRIFMCGSRPKENSHAITSCGQRVIYQQTNAGLQDVSPQMK